MDTIQVQVGGILGSSSGLTQDNTHAVEFEGEKLASRKEYGYNDRTGGVTDTRGVNETLYKAKDGRLVVHVEDWSCWQGEPTIYSLHEVEEVDLQPGGHFADVGAEAGFGRPLTLDEALTPSDDCIS